MKPNDIRAIAETNEEKIREWDKNLIKVILIRSDSMECGVIKIKDSLEEFYRYLDCDYIDIVVRKINGKYFNIIVDDEGLLKDRPEPTAFDVDENPTLFGNLIICNDDGEGNLASLTDDDCDLIMDKVRYCVSPPAFGPVTCHSCIVDIDY